MTCTNRQEGQEVLERCKPQCMAVQHRQPSSTSALDDCMMRATAQQLCMSASSRGGTYCRATMLSYYVDLYIYIYIYGRMDGGMTDVSGRPSKTPIGSFIILLLVATVCSSVHHSLAVLLHSSASGRPHRHVIRREGVVQWAYCIDQDAISATRSRAAGLHFQSAFSGDRISDFELITQLLSSLSMYIYI